MSLYPGATLRLLPENHTAAAIEPTQAIVHSAVDAPGPSSLFPYFARTDVSLETHFFIKLDGEVEQYMDTNKQADANNRANVRAVSIETEDEGNPDERPWTPQQMISLIELLVWLNEEHGIPLRECAAWDRPGLGYHSMWGAPSEWTTVKGKTCPGHVRIVQWKGTVLPAVEPYNDLPNEENEVLPYMVRNGGAVLLVLGAGTMLIVSNAEVANHQKLGVKIIDVSDKQFNYYKNLRVDGG